MPDERDLERELQQARRELEDLRRSEADLRRREERFRTLFDVLPIGVSILDQERRVVAANEALDIILQLPREGILAGAYEQRSYIRADGTPMPADEFPSVRAWREKQAIHNVEIGIVRENAETIWTSVSACPLPVEDLAVAVTTVDITARKQAEQEAQRLLAELVALTHQLESEQTRLHAVLEQMPGAVLIAAAPSGHVILANRQMHELLGDPASDTGDADGYVGLPAFHPDGRPYPAAERPLAHALGRAESVRDREVHFRRADGSSMVMLASAAPIVDTDGHVTAAVATFVDITERHAMEEAVRRARDELSTLLTSSERLASTLDIEPLVGLILDQLAGVVDARELVVYELSDGGDGRLPADTAEVRVLGYRGPLAHDEARATRFALVDGLGLDQAIRQRAPVIVSDLQGEGVFERAWRSHASPLEQKLLAHSRSLLSVPLVVKDRVIGLLQIGHAEPHRFARREADLAQALANHAAVALENARLYRRARELAAVEERQRLARELHDAVSQTLFSASLIADVLPQLWQRNPEAGIESTRELGKLARAALAEMRLLLWELRPAAMLQANPGQMLQQLAEAIGGKGQVSIEVLARDVCPLPPEVQVTLYRIAQEALNNVVKHSHATSATVYLSCAPGDHEQARSARLTILDNGCGFNAGQTTAGRLGLGIMRERAQAIGATFKIDSAPGEGTLITVLWPGT